MKSELPINLDQSTFDHYLAEDVKTNLLTPAAAEASKRLAVPMTFTSY